MRLAEGLVIVVSWVIPASALAQNAPEPTAEMPVLESEVAESDLAELPEPPAIIPMGGACAPQVMRPGDDSGIVVCARRERSYAATSQDYDKGGWAEPPLPPADAATVPTGSCVQFTCLPPPAVNGFSVLGGLYKVAKKLIDGELPE